MRKKEKVLILKMGYSEFLDKEKDSRKVSLGDILRTTPLLHLYKQDSVTWVTDIEAFPLLEGNKYIQRLLPYDLTTVLQLESEEFDSVINLEKIPGICALSDKIHAWKKYGFRFDSETGTAEAHDKALEILAVSADPNSKKINSKTTQELLFQMVGQKWNNEEYILGYKPKKVGDYDIALNTLVGQKWPTKSWPKEKWDELEESLIKEGYKVTRQDKQSDKILKNLNNYTDWINSSKVIITNDSLGLHLAIALKKNFLGLFGPTPHKEVYFYGRGKPILPEPYLECMPCFKGKCNKKQGCMNNISPERIIKEIGNYFK
jgi:heptosyltransferase-2